MQKEKRQFDQKELDEIFLKIRNINKLKYIAFLGWSFFVAMVKLIWWLQMSWTEVFALVLIPVIIFAWENLVRYTPLKKNINRIVFSYFVLQTIEIILLLRNLHLTGSMIYIGSLVFTAYLFIPYFIFEKNLYRWLLIIFGASSYAIVISMEHLGILATRDLFNIGISVERNSTVYFVVITTGVSLMLLIVFLVDVFSRKIQETVGLLSKKEKELEEAKTVLEIRVAARTKELQDMAGSLEEKVAERTKAFQEKVEELEKFQRLTVGREMKMMEMKKELMSLKEKNDKR